MHHVGEAVPQLRYDGQVAVITGGGNGLGRTYALDIAARGGSVVVNDPAVYYKGDQHFFLADRVVQEIRDAGGVAVASHHYVGTELAGERIVHDAIKAFGKIDILINNAGIVRDGAFHKMKQCQMDLVLGVQLNGAMSLTRPVFNLMREQKYGRIIFVTSATALYGNFGQVNYGAGKGGQIGMMLSLAQEGLARGIKVNCIAPLASTTLTEGVVPGIEVYKTSAVSPMVLVLAHKSCMANGEIFEAGAGRFNKAVIVQTLGVVLTDPTPEDVFASMPNIGNLANYQVHGSLMEALEFNNKLVTSEETGVRI